MTPKNIVITPEPVKVYISPVGYHLYASEFLSAAEAVKIERVFSPVPYYLLCRTIELALKAFLNAKGIPVEILKDRKKYGHNLKNILAEAKNRGLTNHVGLTQNLESEIEKANEYYSKKEFEYFAQIKALRGYKQLPDYETLKKFATEIVEKLKKVCYNASGSQSK